MATANLATIQQKVRRLTRSPSNNTLSDEELNQYINTFVLYDFPQHLRLFDLRGTFTFYTQPNVDTYSTNTTDVNDALYDFKNKIVAIHPQVYAAGVPLAYTQDRDEFYGNWPIWNTVITQQATVNGTTGPFIGTINSVPFLQNNVVFSTVGTNDVAQVLVDYPILGNNTLGYLGYPNTPATSLINFGTVNYLTGAYTITFPNNTLNGANLTVENVTYQPGRVCAMLYYNQQFILRPVPDIVYSIEMQVDYLPTQLLLDADVPNLNQWWQYIAYGAAKKIFEDRSDLDSVQLIMPEFKAQEMLVQRATLTQQANERTATIYTQKNKYGNGWGWGPIGWPY